MKKMIILLILLVAAYYYFKEPSTDSIVKNMTVDKTNGSISYKKVVYNADWGGLKTYKGDIRYIGRAYDSAAPIITHDAVITTGDFSDPSLVYVSKITNGRMYWRAEKQPQGTLIVLHFIPANKSVHDKLKRLKTGDKVSLFGREEIDSRITSSDNNLVGLGHDNHKFFLLEKVY